MFWYVIAGIIILAVLVELSTKNNKYMTLERSGELVDNEILTKYLNAKGRKATPDERALLALSEISMRCRQLENVKYESKANQGKMSATYRVLAEELDAWEKKFSKKDSLIIEQLREYSKPLKEIIQWHSLNWQGTKEFEESEKYLAEKYGIIKHVPDRQHLSELITWRKSLAINLINNLPDYMLREVQSRDKHLFL